MPTLKMALKHEIGYRAAHAARALGMVRPTDLTTGPIRLYWWTDRVNFGDVLSPVIVRYISGRDVEWAPLDSSDLISTGSVYGWLRTKSRRYMRDVHVWGSGIQSPAEAVGRTAFLHHHLVRGPLTRIAVGDDALPLGDPGLIGPEAVGVARSNSAKGIGIIPHVADWSMPEMIETYAKLPGVRLIDYRSDDCAGIIAEMAECERIYSSSLHGLILADALGIPNYRFVAKRYASQGWDFKFLDYGLSVGRDLGRPVDLIDHARRTDPDPAQHAYLANIPGIQDAIRQSFPHDVFGSRPQQ